MVRRLVLVSHTKSDSILHCSPKVVPLAQDEIRLRVQRRADFAQSTITAAALEAVLVPEQVEGLQQEPFRDRLVAARTVTLRVSHRIGRCLDRGGTHY